VFSEPVHGLLMICLIVGKSLDKIMELKQLAGDRDLYDVMRRQKRRQKVVDANAAKAYSSSRVKSQSSGYVFDIINHKLNTRKSGNNIIVIIIIIIICLLLIFMPAVLCWSA